MISRHTPNTHKKLKNAYIGIAGLGGLGSNIAASLARMGIGKLLLVDYDLVEPSNLNRQHYFIKNIGMKKTEALEKILKEINPYVKVKTKNIFLEKNNIKTIFEKVDIIIEAFDNPESKAEIVNVVLKDMTQIIIASSGVAGYYSCNLIKTKKINDRFYLIGDEFSEAKPGCGLMSPRVSVAANHQANLAINIILNGGDENYG